MNPDDECMARLRELDAQDMNPIERLHAKLQVFEKDCDQAVARSREKTEQYIQQCPWFPFPFIAEHVQFVAEVEAGRQRIRLIAIEEEDRLRAQADTAATSANDPQHCSE